MLGFLKRFEFLGSEFRDLGIFKKTGKGKKMRVENFDRAMLRFLRGVEIQERISEEVFVEVLSRGLRGMEGLEGKSLLGEYLRDLRCPLCGRLHRDTEHDEKFLEIRRGLVLDVANEYLTLIKREEAEERLVEMDRRWLDNFLREVEVEDGELEGRSREEVQREFREVWNKGFGEEGKVMEMIRSGEVKE